MLHRDIYPKIVEYLLNERIGYLVSLKYVSKSFRKIVDSNPNIQNICDSSTLINIKTIFQIINNKKINFMFNNQPWSISKTSSFRKSKIEIIIKTDFFQYVNTVFFRGSDDFLQTSSIIYISYL